MSVSTVLGLDAADSSFTISERSASVIGIFGCPSWFVVL